MMTLKQTIRRILREELYSPAGEEIKPNKIVVHKSNPMFRDRILDEGLKVRVGECYQIYVNRERRNPDEIKCKPVIFATNSTRKKDWFESTYDDDVWVINTECAKVNWFKDKHYDDDYHIVTFEDISPECLKLIYKGTGESEDLIQENINDNKEEKMVLLIEKSIKTLLKNNKLYCRVEVIPPSKNKNGSYFLDKRKIPYQLNLYIVGGINSKYWPRTQSVLRKESDIVDEVYSFVRDNLPFNISLDVKYVDHCN